MAGMFVNGRGLHTGAACQLSITAAAQLCFKIADNAPFNLTPELAQGQAKGTSIRHASTELTTVEHVLSACAGTGHWGGQINMSGSEPPIADGSALPFLELLKQLPKVSAAPLILKSPIFLADQDSLLVAIPLPRESGRGEGPSTALSPRIRYYASYKYTGDQYFDFDGSEASYRSDIAPARTFCMDYEIEIQRQAGLIKGATPDCAVVYSPSGPSLPLRYANEAVRHKILDLIGDLAILGRPLLADIVAVKTSHKLNIAFAQKLAKLA